MKKLFPLFFIGAVALLFFWQFLFKGLLPIPSDTIIGLYHPYRDLYAKDYPRGIPFKNFLITDPVRQQYPWRNLVIAVEEKLQLPLWNPYNFSGTPLLANFQSASFYPLNILFFFIPFNYAWSVLVLLQPLLAGMFLYLYLANLGVKKIASILGVIVFAFSGFSIAWLEWNTIAHTMLWLPLILLSIDKIFININSINSKFKIQNSKLHFKSKNLFLWSLIFAFSLFSSFLAGHLQTLFYTLILSNSYLIARIIQKSLVNKQKNLISSVIKGYIPFLFIGILVLALTAIQWVPTFQFILQSARGVDQANWQQAGWFIPWQNLIQFIAPDFLGNPTTLNYWGAWNYGEFIGYIGILPLILAIFALFFRHDKKTLFFGIVFFLSLLFSLPTFLAKIPYLLNFPLLSTAQPTRLLALIDFSLAILAAFGFDYFLKSKEKKVIYPIVFIGTVIAGLWIFVFEGNKITRGLNVTDLLVSKQNLYLPTLLFIFSITLILFILKLSTKSTSTIMIRIIIVLLVVFDLFRFGWKFTPFTRNEYLFPDTKTIEFLQKNIGSYRFMTTDSRILPPNFSMIYRLQSVDGYDPLYLKRYGELIAASERGKPDISPPFGFNRIITPHDYGSKIIDLLGVKYILTLSDIKSPKLKKVFQEGETRIYENKNVMPRVFFINLLKRIIDREVDREAIIKNMFEEDFKFLNIALVENFPFPELWMPPYAMNFSTGKAEIIEYSENRVLVRTKNSGEGFLVLTDSFYPTWKAKINGLETKIYRTDYNFRGVVVPKGENTVEFYITLF